MFENLPTNPGCYLFKDKNDKIIYIGKAKNIKKRVASYFNKNHPDAKTQALVRNIRSIDFVATNSESESLLLENNLIKKNKPKYNIDLKDAKSYAYIEITDEAFPRLRILRKKTKNPNIFGPFVSASQRDYVITFLNKVFGIRTCNKFPKRVCLRYHIHLCSGPCENFISEVEYDKRINSAKLVLKGKTKELEKRFVSDMKKYSKEKYYEKALAIKNQLESIKYLSEKQSVERKKKYDEDIINYIQKNNKIYLALFNIYRGTLFNKDEYTFDVLPDFLEQFVSGYYVDHNIPKEIILPHDIDDTVKGALIAKRKSNIRFLIPKKGEKRILLDLVKKNIELSQFADEKSLEELKNKLKLNDIPNIIECFDISHLSGTSMVGSMVQFRGGKPDKSNYRRFKIKTVSKIDDFASISEIVIRRYTRLKAEKTELPNLIIIDGGKGQLSSAIGSLSKLDLKIPIISIAKKQEEIFTPGLSYPIKLSKRDPALKLIQRIRDEAHRFAINYNRLLRKKIITEDSL